MAGREGNSVSEFRARETSISVRDIAGCGGRRCSYGFGCVTYWGELGVDVSCPSSEQIIGGRLAGVAAGEGDIVDRSVWLGLTGEKENDEEQEEVEKSDDWFHGR